MLTPTEQYQLQKFCEKDEQLATLIHKLENSHRLNLSKISHEIRNPVTLINSFLQLTQSKHPEVTSFPSWKPIMENMNYLRQLLEEVSSYNNSRILHRELCSLTNLLESVVSSCRPSLHPIQIQFHKLSAIPSASFDSMKLRAAILNLIRNAREALESSENGKINVSLLFDGEFFHITVSNNGPEIPKEYLKNLFEPFITHKNDGSGLGLSIVQNVTTAHGGELSVSSSPDETCFILKLPLSYET